MTFPTSFTYPHGQVFPCALGGTVTFPPHSIAENARVHLNDVNMCSILHNTP